MSRYPLGQPVTIPITVRDRTGALVDVGGLTILVKLAQADGTLLTTGTYSTPVHDSLGTYHQDIPAADLAAIGHYQYAATSTGTGAGVVPGEFDVFDPFETAVLPLQDGKDQLNIPQATTTYDTELAAYIATIESNLEGATGGPITNRVITERGELDGTCTILQVRQRPLVSVTSITPVATGIAADLSAGLDIDPGAGVIRTKTGATLAGTWDAAVTTVYVAGWGTSVPAAFNLFARIVLQHMWDTQHGPSARPSMGGMEMTTPPGFGFAIPNRAAELLNGSLNGIPFSLSGGVFA